jgi:hypothetical protein
VITATSDIAMIPGLVPVSPFASRSYLAIDCPGRGASPIKDLMFVTASRLIYATYGCVTQKGYDRLTLLEVRRTHPG